MDAVERAVDRASRALAFVGGLGVVLMMVHVVADSAMKYLFDVPIEGTLEVVSQYYMVACVFLPLALVELRGEQVRVDLFLRLMPRRAAVASYVVTAILSAAFFACLAYYTGEAAVHSFRINEVIMGTSYVIVWPSKWLLPVGFALVVVAIVLRLARALLNVRRFDPVSQQHDHDVA
jgi:TRAP-type C4-dicarboxylate transport system permease small subunit